MRGGLAMLAAIALSALAACEPTKTQEYYATHPEELATDVAACKASGKNTFNCNEATKADLILRAKAKQE